MPNPDSIASWIQIGTFVIAIASAFAGWRSGFFEALLTRFRAEGERISNREKQLNLGRLTLDRINELEARVIEVGKSAYESKVLAQVATQEMQASLRVTQVTLKETQATLLETQASQLAFQCEVRERAVMQMQAGTLVVTALERVRLAGFTPTHNGEVLEEDASGIIAEAQEASKLMLEVARELYERCQPTPNLVILEGPPPRTIKRGTKELDPSHLPRGPNKEQRKPRTSKGFSSNDKQEEQN